MGCSESIFHGIVANESPYPIEYIVYGKFEQIGDLQTETEINPNIKASHEGIQLSGVKHKRQSEIKNKYAQSFVRVQSGRWSTSGLCNLRLDQHKISVKVILDDSEKFILSDVVIKAPSDMALKIRSDLSVCNLIQLQILNIRSKEKLELSAELNDGQIAKEKNTLAKDLEEHNISLAKIITEQKAVFDKTLAEQKADLQKTHTKETKKQIQKISEQNAKMKAEFQKALSQQKAEFQKALSQQKAELNKPSKQEDSRPQQQVKQDVIKCPNGHSCILIANFSLMGSYTCNMCHLKIFQPWMSCQICNYDICPLCFKENFNLSDDIRNAKNIKCQQSHTCRPMANAQSMGRFNCNGCRIKIFQPWMRCGLCDYDLCRSCVRTISIVQQFRCPKGHSCQTIRNDQAMGRFQCNECKQMIFESWLQCGKCQYDICQRCLKIDR